MSRPALCELFHASMTHSRPAPAAPPAARAPRWAYPVGALGGGVMGAGVLLMTVCIWSNGPGLSMALVVTGGGAALLGLAELAFPRLAVAGITSLLVPVVLLVARAKQHDLYGQVSATLVCLTLTLFAFGHAISGGLQYTRLFAAAAFVGLVIMLVSAATDTALSGKLDVATFACLALVGLSLPLTLALQPIDERVRT